MNYKLCFSILFYFFLSFNCLSSTIVCDILSQSKKLDNQCVSLNIHSPQIIKYKNIYYMVGQHIPEKNAEGKSRYYGITIVKSKDMIHWTDINFLAKANLESGDLSSGSTIERPKLLVDEKNNNFYIWFHLEKRGMGYNSALVGVLKSKYIDKNYNSIGSFKINKRKLPFGEYDL
uniref:hypothetical protein n=1 Tax=Rosenbergiella collisarenosi TaxID=1544695 RepID=UPI001F4E01D8